MANGCVVFGVYIIWHIALFGCLLRIDDAVCLVLINDVASVLIALVHLVVLPHRVDKECLHDVLSVCHNGVYGIHQVGVVHHYL